MLYDNQTHQRYTQYIVYVKKRWKNMKNVDWVDNQCQNCGSSDIGWAGSGNLW